MKITCILAALMIAGSIHCQGALNFSSLDGGILQDYQSAPLYSPNRGAFMSSYVSKYENLDLIIRPLLKHKYKYKHQFLWLHQFQWPLQCQWPHPLLLHHNSKVKMLLS